MVFSKQFMGYDIQQVDAWWEDYRREAEEARRRMDSAVQQNSSLQKQVTELKKDKARLEKELRLVTLQAPKETMLANFSERQAAIIRSAHTAAAEEIASAQRHAKEIEARATATLNGARRQGEDVVAEAHAEAAAVRKAMEEERAAWIAERDEEKAKLRRLEAESKRRRDSELEACRRDIERAQAEAQERMAQERSDFDIAAADRKKKLDREVATKLAEENARAAAVRRDADAYVEACERRGDDFYKGLEAVKHSLQALEKEVSRLPSTGEQYAQEFVPLAEQPGLQESKASRTDKATAPAKVANGGKK